MKNFNFLSLFCAALLLISCGEQKPTVDLVKPTKQQMAFMDMEVGAFIHYGLNVFTGQEHGDGKEPPSKFNPTEQDVEQWIITAKNMGAKYACLTARHEGGFCLWPTKTTEYSIKNSPYKDGKGDIVREYVDACRKHGIRVGIYFSVMYDAHNLFDPEDEVKWGPEWDRLCDKHFAKMTAAEKQAFCDRQKAQLTELLTNYGEVDYIWNDHWGNYMEPQIQKEVLDLMRELQPNCLMLGPDVTTPGNETGHVVYPLWNAMDTEDGTGYTRAISTVAKENTNNDYGLLETDALTGHPLGKFWRSRECTTNTGFSTGGWFWHPGRTKPLSHERHIELYYRTIGLGASAIINIPPDNRGLIPDDVAAAAKAFGDMVKERFSNPIAKIDKVVKKDVVELKWKEPKEINTIMLMENIENGQKIAAYDLQAYVDGEWVSLKPANNFKAWKPYNSNPGFETIGHKKIDRFEPVTTNRVRFKCLKSVTPDVEIREMAVYNCDPIGL